MLASGLLSFWIWGAFTVLVALIIWSIFHVLASLNNLKQSNQS